MARLIDADNLIAEIKNQYCIGCDNYGGIRCRACWVDDAICLIDDAPTVDAVEVVRCRDCKNYVKFESSLIGEVMCCTGQGSVNIQKQPDDFCSYGERKDGDKL